MSAGHQIAILNLSKRLKPEDVLAMVDAVSRQQALDVCPAWRVPHRPLNIYTDVHDMPIETTDIVPIIDEPGEPGVLGFHSRGIAPYGRVYVNPVLDNQGCVLHDPHDPQRLSLAGVLSHEAAIELPVDPDCTLYAVDDKGNEWDLEPGDMVQRNQYVTYAELPWGKVPVSVSDFVLPDFFRPGSHGPWNFMSTEMPLEGPFTIAPGGYAMVNGQPTYARAATGKAIYPPDWFLAMRPPGARRRLKAAAGAPLKRKLFT